MCILINLICNLLNLICNLINVICNLLLPNKLTTLCQSFKIFSAISDYVQEVILVMCCTSKNTMYF